MNSCTKKFSWNLKSRTKYLIYLKTDKTDDAGPIPDKHSNRIK